LTSSDGGAMAKGELCWGMAIVDKSGVAGVTTVEAINAKKVFTGAVLGNIKSVIISWRADKETTTNSMDEEAREAGEI